MTDKIAYFKRILDEQRKGFESDYSELILKMQPYDVSGFYSELYHAHSYYSSKYFDEERFIARTLNIYSVDLTDTITKEIVFEPVKQYSDALVTLFALKEYLDENKINLDTDEE